MELGEIYGVSLLNAEAKVFWKSIKYSTPESKTAGFCSCLDHTSMFSYLIVEEKKNLTVRWLEMASVRSSVFHQMIKEMLVILQVLTQQLNNPIMLF